MSKILQCVNCSRRCSQEQADQRNFNTGRCGFCGGELQTVAQPPVHITVQGGGEIQKITVRVK